VWGPGTIEFVISAVETNDCHFYGPDAKRLCATSASGRENTPENTSSQRSDFETNSTTITSSSSSSPPPFFTKEEESLLMIRAITQILALDIRSVRNGRGGEPVYQPFPLQGGSSQGGGNVIAEVIGEEDSTSPDTATTQQVDSSVGQWMELYFDVLYIRFTIREKMRTSTNSSSSSVNGGGAFVQVEDVTFAKERKR
jgi:hypothetical protein